MTDEFRRISLMIREDQHSRLLELGVNMSGLIRSLIDDHLSDAKITLACGPASEGGFWRPSRPDDDGTL